MSEIRTSEYNQRGDVFQRTYAFHPSPLDVAERSREHLDLCDQLDYRARVTEAGDRRTAELLREAAARINALETLVLTLKATKRCEVHSEGGTE